MRVRHRHFIPVAPLPGEPDPPDFFSEAARQAMTFSAPELPDILHPDDKYTVGPPYVRVDTSREAASRIKPHTARVREAIYLFIRATGGATAGEIATECGLNPSTVRPRLLELQGKAKWAPGLPARIQRSPEVRKHMHVYRALLNDTTA